MKIEQIYKGLILIYLNLENNEELFIEKFSFNFNN